MKLIFLFLYLITVVLTVVPFQYFESFLKLYGGSGTDLFQYLCETSDGGFVATGYTNGFGANGQDSLTFRIDKKGEVIWATKFDRSGTDRSYVCLEAQDGAIYSLGNTDSKKIFIAKHSPTGSIASIKTIGRSFPTNPPPLDVVYGCVVASDEKLVCAGYTNIEEAGGMGRDAIMFKTDLDGGLGWYRRFGLTGAGNDYAKGVIETEDGGFLFMGNGIISEKVGVITKTNSSGLIEWMKYIPATETDMISVCKTPEGNVFALGFTTGGPLDPDPEVFVMKLNSTGEGLLWIKIVGRGSFIGDSGGMYCTDDGGVFVSFNSEGEAVFVKLNGTGGLEWANKLVNAVGDDGGYHIAKVSNGSFVVLGKFARSGGGDDAMLILIRNNETGSEKCCGCEVAGSISSSDWAVTLEIVESHEYFESDMTSDVSVASPPTLSQPVSLEERTVCVECVDGYYGESCDITHCHGILSNETSEVCYGHGTCDIDTNVCQCKDDYFGEICNITLCFGILRNDTDDVCNGHGDCFDLDKCACIEDYYGEHCNISICHGILSNITSEVCYGHGTCVIETHRCVCGDGYFGVSCNVTSCFGIARNETESVCSGNGDCYSIDKCNCFDDYLGEYCNISYCYGVLSNDSSEVCYSHGVCDVYTHDCRCEEGYFGKNCNVTTCSGILRNDTEKGVCSGHGDCVDNEVCGCLDLYYGERCNVTTCGGIFGNVSSVCNWRGRCVSFEFCQCNRTDHYHGNLCQHTYCNNISSTSEKVCSGHESCNEFESCTCTDLERYTGKYCNYWKCYGEWMTNTSFVCKGHGSCIEPDICFCSNGYSSSDNENFGVCDRWYCFGKDYDSNSVCSSRGTCDTYDSCDCGDGYEGEICETWSCGAFDYKLTDLTCNGNGKCKSPGVCKCEGGYAGDICETNTMIYTVMIPLLSLSGLVFFMFLCSIILGVCCACCVSVVTFSCCLCFLGVVVCRQRSGIKKFSKLRNFDVLMKEQELEDDDTIAHIKFNKKLFEVDFEEIKTVAILGDGGSQSVVFKAIWKGQVIAFKCFKTRTVCSNSDTFEEFEREVEILSSISHPNIIRFFGATLKQPRVGILMEFCPKGELLQFLVAFRKKYLTRYPIYQKVRLLKEVVSALEYLHSRSIIHRDLKCENVLISSDDAAKLMDFGLSRVIDATSNKTKRIGTSFYMPPEIVLGSQYDEKCDLFSFSIMMYIVLTENNNPYDVSNQMNIELKVSNNPDFRPDLEILAGDREALPEDFLWMTNVMKRCWDHDPEERYSSEQLRKMFESKGSVVFAGDDENKNDNTMEETIGGGQNNNRMYNDVSELSRKDRRIKELVKKLVSYEARIEKIESYEAKIEQIEEENRILREKLEE